MPSQDAPVRLDRALLDRGLVDSRTRAAREITAGRVRVDGRPATKPSQPVTAATVLELVDPDPWVARSAHKLLGALDDLDVAVRVPGSRCLDAGASTGGFTQVLLHHGAARVYAVDVGHDQLSPRVAEDPRVVDLEGHSLRDLVPEWTEGPVDLLVADVSFISLRLLLPRLLAVLAEGGDALLMVKPQFEVGRSGLDRHGVVTDPHRRATAVAGIAEAAEDSGGIVVQWAPSRLPGPTGNREYFLHIRTTPHGEGGTTHVGSGGPRIRPDDLRRAIAEEDR